MYTVCVYKKFLCAMQQSYFPPPSPVGTFSFSSFSSVLPLSGRSYIFSLSLALSLFAFPLYKILSNNSLANESFHLSFTIKDACSPSTVALRHLSILYTVLSPYLIKYRTRLSYIIVIIFFRFRFVTVTQLQRLKELRVRAMI